MAFGIIKNIDNIEHVWGGVVISANPGTYTCSTLDESIRFAKDDSFISALSSGLAKVNNGTNDIVTVSDAIEFLLGSSIKITDQPPYARPDYRTKMDATTNIAEVQPNSSTIIDHRLTEERYISGGDLIILGAEIGDYVTAEIHDVDGVIPAPYRSFLCENHPTVATYINKMWVDPTAKNVIDTRPLNAKITGNLYLRITYYAINQGTTRKVGVNYHLTKKL